VSGTAIAIVGPALIFTVWATWIMVGIFYEGIRDEIDRWRRGR